MTDNPRIGDQQYEIGQIISFEYHDEYGKPTLFEGQVRITSWNPETKEIGFQIVDGPVGGSFISTPRG